MDSFSDFQCFYYFEDETLRNLDRWSLFIYFYWLILQDVYYNKYSEILYNDLRMTYTSVVVLWGLYAAICLFPYYIRRLHALILFVVMYNFNFMFFLSIPLLENEYICCNSTLQNIY